MASADGPYQPFEDARHEIRLVLIDPIDPAQPDLVQCNTQTFRLEGNNRPAYKALSYMWGTSDNTVTARLNGNDLQITKFLSLALRRLRKDASIQYLWIDAICIDQNNTEEKNHQLPLMGRIYSAAEEVIVPLLGGEDDHDGTAVEFLKDWVKSAILAQDGVDMNVSDPSGIQNAQFSFQARSLFRTRSLRTAEFLRTLGAPFDGEKWKYLGRLLNHPYWKRIWIIQELMLATRVRCFWGNLTFDLTTFLALPKVFKMLRQANQAFSTSAQKKEQNDLVLHATMYQRAISEAVTTLSWLYELKITSGLALSLAEVVSLTRGSKATDPRDRVFGLLGIADAQSTIVPDYNLTPAQTYVKFALAEIQRTKSLQICFLTCGLPGRVTTDLPSWAPDLCQRRAESFSLSNKLEKLCFAAGQSKLNFQVSKDLRVLGVSGWHATRIYQIESRLEGEDLDKTLERFYARFTQFLSASLQTKQLPNGLSPIEALFRTVVLDSSRYAPPHNLFRDEQHAAQLHNQMIMFGCFLDIICDKRQAAGEQSEHALPNMDRFYSECSTLFRQRPARAELRVEAISQIQGDVLKSNDFFWSDDGYMGLVTKGIQPGDVICILSGLSVPAVLRPFGGNHRLVGECYCFGMMQGELVMDMRTGKRKLEVFRII